MDFAGDALYRLVRFDDTYGFRLAIRLRVERRVGLDGPGSVSATLERACTLENVRSRRGWWPIRQSWRDDKGEAQACNCRLLHAANAQSSSEKHLIWRLSLRLSEMLLQIKTVWVRHGISALDRLRAEGLDQKTTRVPATPEDKGLAAKPRAVVKI